MEHVSSVLNIRENKVMELNVILIVALIGKGFLLMALVINVSLIPGHLRTGINVNLSLAIQIKD